MNAMDDDVRESDQICLLVLQNLPDTAANTLHKLFSVFGNLQGILNAPSGELSTIMGAPALRAFDEYRHLGLSSSVGEQASRHLEYLQKNRIALLTIGSAHYPRQLAEIHSAPPLLMVEGCLELLGQDQIAIVGSRRASPSGIEIARQFALELATSGLGVTSGLATGVDAAAHRGALSVDRDLNPHPTIAVVATGLDLCYPHGHESLKNEIRERGAVISEFPLGTPPRRENFPRRNRIISGLAKGVLIVEAEQKSGSLITARYATEQNREVFAIPGPIQNPGSRGCHQLIREGAKLVESVDDVLTELQHPFGQILVPFRPEKNAFENGPMTDMEECLVGEEALLIEFMDSSPVTIDQLVRRSGKRPEEVLATLTSLELKNRVIATAQGYLVNSTAIKAG